MKYSSSCTRTCFIAVLTKVAVSGVISEPVCIPPQGKQRKQQIPEILTEVHNDAAGFLSFSMFVHHSVFTDTVPGAEPGPRLWRAGGKASARRLRWLCSRLRLETGEQENSDVSFSSPCLYTARSARQRLLFSFLKRYELNIKRGSVPSKVYSESLHISKTSQSMCFPAARRLSVLVDGGGTVCWCYCWGTGQGWKVWTITASTFVICESR